MPAGWAAAADLSADSEAAGCALSRAQPVRPLPPLPCRPPDSRPALLTTPQLARSPPFHHGLNSLLTLVCRPLVDRTRPSSSPSSGSVEYAEYAASSTEYYAGRLSVAEYAASPPPPPPPHPPLLPPVPSPPLRPPCVPFSSWPSATLPPSTTPASLRHSPLPCSIPAFLLPTSILRTSARYSVAALRVIGAAARSWTGQRWRVHRLSVVLAAAQAVLVLVALLAALVAIARGAWGGAVAAAVAALFGWLLLAVELAQAAAPLGVACRQVAPPLSNSPLPNPLSPTLT